MIERHTFVVDAHPDGRAVLVDHVGPPIRDRQAPGRDPAPVKLGAGSVFVAVATGPRYPVLGTGATAEEAEAAAFAAWIGQGPGMQIDPAYGGPLETVAAFREYFGFWTVGPLAIGSGVSQ